MTVCDKDCWICPYRFGEDALMVRPNQMVPNAMTMHALELPYLNGIHYFKHLANWPYAIFLDGSPKHTQERYQIISAKPCQLLCHHYKNDFFDQIKKTVKKLFTSQRIPKTIQSLPFKIGAIGCLTYDLSKLYYPIQTKTIEDIHLPYGIFGIYDWSIVTDHHEQKTWLITLSKHKRQEIQQQLSMPPLNHDPFEITSLFRSNMCFSEYVNAFSKIHYHIQRGDCYQANLAQRFQASYSGSPWQAYQILRDKNPVPFSAYFNIDTHAILSFSPERFMKVSGDIVETKPIKGTAKRFSDQKQDTASAMRLLKSEKDLAENLMIVDLLRNDLGKCCRPGSIQVPKLAALESFPNVHHLVSTITGKLKSTQNAIDLLKHSFPGGSITGAPKLRAMQIIESIEPHHRSAYCGTIGYWDVEGGMDTNILIRTLIADQQQLYAYAGGAIVADSKADEEYQESKIKIENLLYTLTRYSANSNHEHSTL